MNDSNTTRREDWIGDNICESTGKKRKVQPIRFFNICKRSFVEWCRIKNDSKYDENTTRRADWIGDNVCESTGKKQKAAMRRPKDETWERSKRTKHGREACEIT